MAAVFFLPASTLPPRRARHRRCVGIELQRRTVAGAFHVHTHADPTAPATARDRRRRRAGRPRSSSSSPITATAPAHPIHPRTCDGVLCIDARRDQHERRPLRRARHAALRRIRSAASRRRSSKTSRGSAASASRRIRIRRRHELAWTDWSAADSTASSG